MTPDEAHALMMGYIDGELSPSEREAFEAELAANAELRAELEQFKVFKEQMAQVAGFELGDAVLRRFDAGRLTRVEQVVGWTALVGGATVLSALVLREMFGELRENPLEMGAVLAILFGVVTLLGSVLRRRWALRKVDRYSREVER